MGGGEDRDRDMKTSDLSSFPLFLPPNSQVSISISLSTSLSTCMLYLDPHPPPIIILHPHIPLIPTHTPQTLSDQNYNSFGLSTLSSKSWKSNKIRLMIFTVSSLIWCPKYISKLNIHQGSRRLSGKFSSSFTLKAGRITFYKLICTN